MNILDHLNASFQFQNKLDYRKAFLSVTLQQLSHLLKKKVVNLLLFGHWHFFPTLLICLAILNTKCDYVHLLSMLFSLVDNYSNLEWSIFLVTGVKVS